MTKLPKIALALAAFLPIALPPLLLDAQAHPSSEKQKIELLIKRVGELKDVKFLRNGSTYNPGTAPLSYAGSGKPTSRR